MRTISVSLHSRPEMVEGVVNSILLMQELDKFDLVMFSVDGGHANSKKCVELASACAGALSDSGVIECEVLERGANMGIDEHARSQLWRAFDDLGSGLHLYLEDDARPKSDLLRVLLWWQENKQKDSPVFCGGNHRDFGRGLQAAIPEDDPALVGEGPHLSSPFCWATTKFDWWFVDRWFSFKKECPVGFDWSLSMAMRLNKKVATHPILSRCQNVGKVGTNETPRSFAATQEGLKFQEGEYLGPYSLVAKFDREELKYLDDWMLPELQRLRGEEVVPWSPTAESVVR